MKSKLSFLFIATLALGAAAALAFALKVDPGSIAVGFLGLALLGETATFSSAEIKAALEKIGDQVKEVGEKALGEAKTASGVANKTKETADELLLKQAELTTRLQATEQKMDALSKAGLRSHGAQPSAGSEVANSEAFKSYVADGNFRKSFQMGVKDITSANGSAGQTIEPDRLSGLIVTPDRRMTVRDLLTPGRTNSNLIQYVRETGFTNAATTVLESAAKPKSDITFDLVATAVVKLATYVKASSEILMDTPMMQSYIDGRLRYMLSYVEEAQLLKGSGVGNNLNGIYTQATPFVAPIVVAGATRIDVLRLAMLQAELAEYPATASVINPADWAAIELLKDAEGRYIIGNPQGNIAPTLWGRSVVTTQAMTQDEFLVGAFRLGAQVFDRMQSSVVVATENEDDFIKNMVTILAEERLGLAVYRPQAFIKGDLTPAQA